MSKKPKTPFEKASLGSPPKAAPASEQIGQCIKCARFFRLMQLKECQCKACWDDVGQSACSMEIHAAIHSPESFGQALLIHLAAPRFLRS